MCDETSLTDSVIEFYNDMNRDASFASRVNTEDLTPAAKEIASRLNPETMLRYYGSGFLVPEVLEGARILDLGSGSGSLVFLLSKLVGPTGYVVGVDLAEHLLENAKQQSGYHCKEWGYDKPNFEFLLANIENVTELGTPKESFDVVVCNGVLGLCANKGKVIQQAFEMLKPNGMFLLGDAFAELSQSKDTAKCNKMLTCRCFTGQLAWKELAPLVVKKGFTTPYLTSCGSIEIHPEISTQLGNSYLCAEARIFKLAPGTQQKGTTSVTYKGTIPNYEKSLPFDVTTVFKTGEAVNIDGELATNLSNSDFAEHFTFGEATGEPQNKKNQDPFEILNEREKNKKAFPPRYVS